MAHEISRNVLTGKDEAFYAINGAWHGLGTVLDHAPTSEEAITAAGLNWDVSTIPVFGDGATLNGKARSMVDGGSYRMNVRDDTNQCLGIVTEEYATVQNRDAFTFLDSLVQDGVMKYESAMALRGGRVVVVLARMPGFDEIADGDQCARYVLIQTSHDGSMKLNAIPTSVRVVCMNTLRMALAGRNAFDMEGIRHTGDMDKKLDLARKYLSQFNAAFTLFRDDARKLATRKINSRDQVTAYLEKLFPMPKEVKNAKGGKSKAVTFRDAKLADIKARGTNPNQTLPSIRGTWWALANAVTEMVDHSDKNIYRGEGRERDEARYFNISSGKGADLKNNAFKLAVEMSA